MKPRLFLPLALCLFAAAALAEDLSTYQTADALWAHVQELRKEPATQPKTRDEMIAMVKDWFGKQREAAEAFLVKYPGDQRRWEAKMIVLQTAMQLSQVPGADPATKISADTVLKDLEAIVAAPDAPVDTKGEAAFIQAMMQTEKLDPTDPGTVATVLQAGDAFLEKYGSHRFAPQMRQAQLQIAGQYPSPASEAFLKKIAEGKDEALASTAKQLIVSQQKTKELTSKPMELKFTATDGKEVDFAKLRGKVVLIDFWASWCGPCIAEMPNVVATYQKLHDKGFEIVGISLDQDQAEMDAALKKHGMIWPQQFDGKGWKNEIAETFGIKSIPATWLIDKKGMVRDVGLRGEVLAIRVEKLLAE
jgi:thiol-disulfide isomerase/thioredoxin